MYTVKTKTSVYQIVHARSVVSDSLQRYGLAHQAPLSMGFPRQEYWSGLPFPSLGDLPNPGLNLRLLHLLHCRWILYCGATNKTMRKEKLGGWNK